MGDRMRGLALLLLFALAGCERGDAQAAPPPAALAPKLSAELAIASYWGSGEATVRTATFDGAGNLYLSAGTQNPAGFPQTAPSRGRLGFWDLGIAKFDATGKNLWSIVIGGPGEDYPYVSALDREGNLIVGGRGGPDFPMTAGAFDKSFNGGFPVGPHGPTDGFLLSISPAGALRWATYIGGKGDDIIRAIQTLPDGRIAIAGGMAEADDLPVTPGVVKPKLGGAKDAWVAAVRPDGAALDFLTYFGPSDDRDRKADETLRAIGLDAAGELWLAGTTQGSDLTPTPDAFQKARGGGGSAFVAKLSLDGRRIPYFSWLGGNEGDDVETEGLSDARGAFYIAGGTSSVDFPATSGAVSRGGGDDGWIARIEPSGALGMALRFGGSGDDHFFGPALDAAGFVYASGTVHSTDLPVTAGALQPRFGGGPSDSMLAAFDPSGALAFSTYFGGSGSDTGRFVAADPSRRRVVLIGDTQSPDLPMRNAAQTKPGGVYFAIFEVTPIGSVRD